jgi:hypothetical protein
MVSPILLQDWTLGLSLSRPFLILFARTFQTNAHEFFSTKKDPVAIINK